eukprot:459021-Hanusia_phi.AAC.2
MVLSRDFPKPTHHLPKPRPPCLIKIGHPQAAGLLLLVLHSCAQADYLCSATNSSLLRIISEHSCFRIRGGGRLSLGEKRWRRKQAREQFARKEGPVMKPPSKKNNKQEAYLKSLKTISSAASDIADRIPVLEHEIKATDDLNTAGNKMRETASTRLKSLEEMEEQARELLKRVQQEKGAAMRLHHGSKKNRKKLQRKQVDCVDAAHDVTSAQARIDHATNWRSLM